MKYHRALGEVSLQVCGWFSWGGALDVPRAPKAPGHSLPRPPWRNSTRREGLPPDWPARVAIVRRRAGGRCQQVEDGHHCEAVGTDCDHIVPGSDHSLPNLQWLCSYHHRHKSALEGAAAAEAARGRPQN